MQRTPIWSKGGGAMCCLGELVLGYWYCPFNAENLRACSDHYRLSTQAGQGHFSVLSVFRVNPYAVDALGAAAREQVRDMLAEHAAASDAIVCVMQGSPLIAAAMRLSAAATTLLTGSRALRFVSTLDEGLAEVRKERVTATDDVIVEHLRAVEEEAAAGAPQAAARAGRPTWRESQLA
jgi:hypothetical protein